ncbi:N-glycosylase/DNA lyase [Candidatus Woesearchaeota archaeon]|nr:N-glycosylase/DNA lyase [Candidatus Woesearchaeota archaeon]
MDIKELKRAYSRKKNEIRQRLAEFKKQKDHFYELCFCLLTPQSNAFKCDECIKALKEEHFEKKAIKPEKILKKYTRFHNNKSRYLIRIKQHQNQIFSDLKKIKDPKEKRDYIIRSVKGIGLKEASHFLRNTGCRNLAILDRHILKNLKELGVIKEIPKSLTKNRYIKIEKKFYDFSKKIKIPMDELDLLFWSMETGKVFK